MRRDTETLCRRGNTWRLSQVIRKITHKEGFPAACLVISTRLRTTCCTIDCRIAPLHWIGVAGCADPSTTAVRDGVWPLHWLTGHDLLSLGRREKVPEIRSQRPSGVRIEVCRSREDSDSRPLPIVAVTPRSTSSVRPMCPVRRPIGRIPASACSRRSQCCGARAGSPRLPR